MLFYIIQGFSRRKWMHLITILVSVCGMADQYHQSLYLVWEASGMCRSMGFSGLVAVGTIPQLQRRIAYPV